MLMVILIYIIIHEACYHFIDSMIYSQLAISTKQFSPRIAKIPNIFLSQYKKSQNNIDHEAT